MPALLLTSHGAIQVRRPAFPRLRSGLTEPTLAPPQFSIYEELKQWMPADRQTLWGMSSTFAIGSVSKLVATTATYPYQVIKSRMQSRSASGEPPYKGVLDCARRTASAGGWRMFYAGYTANVIRVVPSGAITLTLYELAKPTFHTLLAPLKSGGDDGDWGGR